MNKYVHLLTKLRIHPLLWIVFAIAVATAHFKELILLFFIIFIHELGHGVAAAFFSWRIKKISLLPFGGVIEMDEHGNRPLLEEAIVVLAGPIQHVWLLLVSYLLLLGDLISPSTFTTFVKFNGMIFFFNMLPIWPLDGGKLVFLLSSLKYSFPKALDSTIKISLVTLSLFMFTVFIVEPYNLNVWIVISFLIFSLYVEWKQSRYVFFRFLLERYYGKNEDLRTLKPIVVDEDILVMHVLEQFQRGCKHPIVIEKDGEEKGILDENELLHAYFAEKQVMAKVGDLLYDY